MFRDCTAPTVHVVKKEVGSSGTASLGAERLLILLLTHSVRVGIVPNIKIIPVSGIISDYAFVVGMIVSVVASPQLRASASPF